MEKLKIQTIPYTQVKPYDKNPRKNDKAVPIVTKSIAKYGFLVPIIIDKDNVIIAGHTRTRAYPKAIELLNEMIESTKKQYQQEQDKDKKEQLKNQLKTEQQRIDLLSEGIPTIQADNLTPEQIKAFRIMDNKSQEYAGWDYATLKIELEELKKVDFELEFTGFTESNLKRIMDATPERESGGKKAKYEITEGIYKLGRHYLIVGDCTKVEYDKLLNKDKIQAIYTDPPYGVSYKGNHSETIQEKVGMRIAKDWDVIEGDNLRNEDLYNLLVESFAQANKHLAEGVSAYVFHAQKNQIIFETALKKTGWEVRQQLIWKKPSVISNAHYHWSHEPIFYCSRTGKPAKFYGDRLNKTVIDEQYIEKLTPEEAKKFLKKMIKLSTVQEFKKDNSMNYIHPTQKPVNMAEFFITNNTQKGDWVLDMFGGSGSTLIACENIKRNCIICELDKKYASHIIERWENQTQLKHERVVIN